MDDDACFNDGRDVKRRAGRRADDARPVAEDAMERVLLGRGFASEVMRRCIVRWYYRRGAFVLVTTVPVRRRRPHCERRQRHERRGSNRSRMRAHPGQHE